MKSASPTEARHAVEPLQLFWQWLDADAARAGEKYELLRRKLTAFFTRHDQRILPEEWADLVIDRVARQLAASRDLRDADPAAYCHGVARKLLLEFARHPANRLRAEWEAAATNRQIANQSAAATRAAQADERESDRQAREAVCLKQCLRRLPEADRVLLQRYFGGGEPARAANRQTLAAELGLSYGNLRLRAHRLRQDVRECIERCLARIEL